MKWKVALAVLLMIAGVMVFANAEEKETFTCGDYEYTLAEDGTAVIMDYNGKDEKLTIPSELDGHIVKGIGDRAFSWCKSLTSITLPDGITSIGDRAFYGCESLTSITLPDSITSIGDRAFYGCESLTSITLPDSITDLGANPWRYCRNLAAITVSPKNPSLAVIDGVLYSKADKRLVWYPMTSR